VGISWQNSSQRSEAVRAASDLMQVAQGSKPKHKYSQAACESKSDEFEMENAVSRRVLMAEGCTRCVLSLAEGGVVLRRRSDVE
jgi:hypothetical protein